MKITLSTPDRLEIEDRPWVLWLLLYGMGGGAFIALALGQTDGIAETLLVAGLAAGTIWVAWRFQPFQRITFDRPTGRFTHEIRRLGRPPQIWQRDLGDIEAAITGNYEGSSRTALRTSSGIHPLEAGFTGSDRSNLTRAINEWLNS